MHRWIPNRELNSLDLSELASPERALSEECERIEAKVGAHLAVYKKGTLAKPKGLSLPYIPQFL
ncbi:hypothetical protein CH379_014380 [Leptospira ellisii]|uniref:Uncharacterized protein n=1 Tax=Leptospira ellisii TaxID=2023197 RepID=A0AAE4U0M6_9LEPT|nr:hypothetical protein [Leptospira ellisii]MDV6236812.1 hypothetical protein [Leptospira ellisii]